MNPWTKTLTAIVLVTVWNAALAYLVFRDTSRISEGEEEKHERNTQLGT